MEAVESFLDWYFYSYLVFAIVSVLLFVGEMLLAHYTNKMDLKLTSLAEQEMGNDNNP